THSNELPLCLSVFGKDLMNNKQPMKGSQKRRHKARQLVLRAEGAEKLLAAARGHAREAKARFKEARKAFKMARKVAKMTRKEAKHALRGLKADLRAKSTK